MGPMSRFLCLCAMSDYFGCCPLWVETLICWCSMSVVDTGSSIAFCTMLEMQSEPESVIQRAIHLKGCRSDGLTQLKCLHLTSVIGYRRNNSYNSQNGLSGLLSVLMSFRLFALLGLPTVARLLECWLICENVSPHWKIVRKSPMGNAGL